MDQKLRADLSTNRFYHFQLFLFITFGIQVATMLAIVFGNTEGKELVIGTLSLAGGVMGILGTSRTMDDLKNLIKDLDDEIRKTNYGAELVKAPIPVLKAIISVFYILVVGAQLLYLFT